MPSTAWLRELMSAHTVWGLVEALTLGAVQAALPSLVPP